MFNRILLIILIIYFVSIINGISTPNSKSYDYYDQREFKTNRFKSTLNGNFWHITDTHYDFSYKVGGDPDEMCRNDPTILSSTTYITDRGEGERRPDGSLQQNTASAVGNYRCDTPYKLLISSFEEMVKIEPDPDFIIWTGDDVPHLENSELNQTIIIQSITNMTDLIQYYFPGVRVFPSIGNHDSYPQHQISVGPNWLLNQVSVIWSPFLSNDSIDTVKIGGYYTELIEEGLRIISLNTVFYYTEDKQCTNLTDPAGQLQWLNQTLYQARLNNEKVYIIAHVAPGYNFKYDIFNFHKEFNDIYLLAFSNYSDIIIAHFYGHEHTDAFRLYYNQDTLLGDKHGSEEYLPSGIMFLSPSLTPWMTPYLPALPNNPSLRLYQYNVSTSGTGYQVLDYLQFWTNLTANILSDNIDWQLEYRATEFFHVASLDPISMYEAFMLIESDDDLLNQFHYYTSVSYPTKGCDEICKKILLCSIRNTYIHGFQECLIIM